MFYDDRRMAGLLVFVGVAQFLVFLVVAEAADPTYSVGGNFISDLGNANLFPAAAPIFNTSIVVLGILVLPGAYYANRTFHNWFFTISLLMTAFGAIGVGVFNETFGAIHSVVSLITFVGTGLAAISAFRLTKPPLAYIGVVMGILSFAALGLFVARATLGIGVGGMERMIILPAIGWALAFGGSLMAPAATATA